jgi:hypothetical protein
MGAGNQQRTALAMKALVDLVRRPAAMSAQFSR